MYNPELKESYLAYCKDICGMKQNSLDKIRRTFSWVEDYEKNLNQTDGKKGKDIYEMDSYELLGIFEYHKIYKPSSVRTYHSVMKKYIDWCMLEKKFKINLLAKRVSPAVVMKTFAQKDQKNEKCFTKEEFKNYSDCIYKTYYKDLANYINGMILVVYHGICLEYDEIANLRLSDINEKESKICGIPVDKKLINLLKQVEGISEISYSRKTMELNSKLQKDSIFKFYSDHNIVISSKRNLKSMLDRFRETTNTKLRIRDIFDCGLIHYVWEQYEKTGRNEFINDVLEGSMDMEFNQWINQKSTMGISAFRSKYKDILKYCIEK